MHKRSILLMAALIATLSILGCEKKDITGQIFWKSGETSVKLSDVKIELFNLDKYTNQTARFALNVESMMKTLISNEAELASTRNVLQTTTEYVKSWTEIRKITEISRSLDWHSFDQSIEKIKILASLANEKASKLEEQRKQIIEGQHHRLFIANEIQPLIVTTSDADGQFKLKTPSGEKFLVRASTEHSSWYVEPNPSSESILLSPTNAHGSKCSECVFDRLSEESIVKAISINISKIATLPEFDKTSELATSIENDSKKLASTIKEYNRMSEKINKSSTLASLYSMSTIVPELAAKQYDEKINILNAQQRKIELINGMQLLLEDLNAKLEQVDARLQKQ